MRRSGVISERISEKASTDKSKASLSLGMRWGGRPLVVWSLRGRSGSVGKRIGTSFMERDRLEVILSSMQASVARDEQR